MEDNRQFVPHASADEDAPWQEGINGGVVHVIGRDELVGFYFPAGFLSRPGGLQLLLPGFDLLPQCVDSVFRKL